MLVRCDLLSMIEFVMNVVIVCCIYLLHVLLDAGCYCRRALMSDSEAQHVFETQRLETQIDDMQVYHLSLPYMVASASVVPPLPVRVSCAPAAVGAQVGLDEANRKNGNLFKKCERMSGQLEKKDGEIRTMQKLMR